MVLGLKMSPLELSECKTIFFELLYGNYISNLIVDKILTSIRVPALSVLLHDLVPVCGSLRSKKGKIHTFSSKSCPMT